MSLPTDSLEALLKIMKRNIATSPYRFFNFNHFSSMTFLLQFVFYESSVVEDSKYSYAEF